MHLKMCIPHFSAAYRFQTVRFSLFLRFCCGFLYNNKGRGRYMSWIAWALVIILILIAAEAVFIMPDKMPWNRRKRK